MATVNISAMAKTWNDAGTTFTAIGLDVTDTASNAASLLLDLQVGGSSMFNVNKRGDVEVPQSASFSAPSFKAAGFETGMSLVNNTLVSMVSNGTGVASFKFNQGMMLKSTLPLQWGNANVNGGGDVFLYRDAAATLALRNSTTAQTYRVYGTYTNSSNYERLAITRDAITVESAGTGAANIDLALTPAGTGVVKFGAHTTLGGESVTGYITIKDAGGTSRKIAVVS